MRYYYVLGDGQPNDRAVYFTNTTTAYGDGYWGDITEAYLFNNMSEVAERLIKCPELRCFIIEIADVTLERCKEGKQNLLTGNLDNEYTDLFRKFNTVSYALNSK